MRKTPVAERFWSKADVRGPDDCWPWLASRMASGYGHISVNGSPLKAHRVAYEISAGRQIPPGMEVLHKCDNPPCVNPAHLSVGTHADNMRDSAQKRRFPNSKKKTCPKGHPYDRSCNGARYCSICKQESRRRSLQRQGATP